MATLIGRGVGTGKSRYARALAQGSGGGTLRELPGEASQGIARILGNILMVAGLMVAGDPLTVKGAASRS